ncbi:hypothetical protein, partial [Streptomyces gobitricini]|uniref:hypothetical protein n=1 Tax=Streptomyces gobitricini TaxID=68211 RepID=UPI0031DD8511
MSTELQELGLPFEAPQGQPTTTQDRSPQKGFGFRHVRNEIQRLDYEPQRKWSKVVERRKAEALQRPPETESEPETEREKDL